MASGSTSDSVKLTSYTLNRAQTVHGSAPTSEFSVKPKPRRTVADFEFFFEEFKRMKEALAARETDAQPDEEEEEEEEKAKKDGEEEAEWLKQVGLKSLVSDFEADRELDINDVEFETSKLSLTMAQRAAVRRRVDTLNATVRRRRRTSPICDDGSGSAGTLADVFTRKPVVDIVSKDVLKSPSTEEAPELPVNPLVLGVTRTSDLSADDNVRLRRLAFLELTTILETYDIPVKVRKAPKRKFKETGIFGVPLTTLMARDKQLDSTAKAPLFLQEIIVFLEQKGIEEEGILRIPGASARIKSMIRELEETFYDGDFSWDNRRTNDAATLLKQFLRDLPYPLLTYEYLYLFASIDGISDKDIKFEALNLLVILLPDCHRATLQLLLKFLSKLVEHEAQNKMSINNVAMIMAPNLFLSRQRNHQTRESDLQMAARTYNVMRMLIQHHDSLWIVPVNLLSQVRQLNETEKRRVNRLGMRGMAKKKRSGGDPLSPIRRSSDNVVPADSSLLVSKESQERMKNIIRVRSPQFAKVSMAFELTPSMTAGDLVAKFLKKSYDNMTEKGSEQKQQQHPIITRRESFKITTKPLGNHHLFEVGGNIGERCLPHDSIIMAVLKVNPCADWVIKEKELDF